MGRARGSGHRLAAGLTVGLTAGLAACRFGDDARPSARAGGDAAPGAADARAVDGPPGVDGGPRVDGAPGVPDLVWVADEMTPTVHLDNVYFRAEGCEVQEGCVGGPGMRRILRFAAVSENQGTGPLVLGPPPPPGVSDDVFVWSDCHQHHHVAGYADFALVDGTGEVAAGHKQAFCLRDDERERLGAPPGHFTCTDQGITPGWADVYDETLPCQWIDVTGVPPGLYTLRIQVNPQRLLPESDYDNDTLEISVAL
jgi:Lysyl oxidase